MEELSATLAKTCKGKAYLYPVLIGGSNVNASVADYLAAFCNLSDNITFVIIAVVCHKFWLRTLNDLHLIIYDGLLIDIWIVVKALSSESADVRAVAVKSNSHPLEVIRQLQGMTLVA